MVHNQLVNSALPLALSQTLLVTKVTECTLALSQTLLVAKVTECTLLITPKD